MARSIPKNTQNYEDLIYIDPTETQSTISYEVHLLLRFLTREKNSDAVALYVYYLNEHTYNAKTSTIHRPRDIISQDLKWSSPNKITKARKALESVGLIQMYRLPGKGVKRRCVTKINKRISLEIVTKILKKQDPIVLNLIRKEFNTANKLLRSNNSLDSLLQVASDHATRSKKIIKKDFPTKYKNLVKRIRKIHLSNERINRPLTEKDIISQSDTIDKLVRIDKYDFNTQIKPCLIWAANDSFWSANFLSCANLRQRKTNDLTKFDKIYAQYKKSGVSKLTVSCPYENKFIQPILDYLQIKNDTQKQKLYDNLQSLIDFVDDIPKRLKHNDLFTDSVVGYSGTNRFIHKYIKFLQQQDWIENPSIALFNEDSKTWKKYIEHVESCVFEKMK